MEEKKQEKTKKKIVFYLIPILIFVVFIGYMMIRTFTGEVKAAVTETTLSSAGFENLSDTFEDVLQENMYGKNEYINLNGLTTRVLGINSLNERQKLRNGFLASFEGIKDTEYVSDEVIELNDLLENRNIEFLCILIPSQASFYDAEFAPGYIDDSWQNIENISSALNNAGIDFINLNSWFAENGWSMENALFKTDHHWRPEASFQTAKLTMEYLSDLGLAEYNQEFLDENNWTITILEDWFLGSSGKRVGTTYAGVDDFSVYFPNFNTNYTYSYLNFNSTDWTYRDNPLNLIYMERKDYFNDAMNGLYLFDNFPIRKLTNTEAKGKEKVLVIGDSNRRSYEYFLSTQFQEVWAIDLRYYSDGTLAQYIAETQPDIVILCFSESEITDHRLYTFGVNAYINELESTDENSSIIKLGDFKCEPKEGNQNNFNVICSILEPGQTYTLTLDSTSYSGGEDLFVQMTLQDLSTNTAVYNRYFDANSDETQKWIFTVPEGMDTYAIYFYAGTKGHTANVSAEVTNVILRDGIFED